MKPAHLVVSLLAGALMTLAASALPSDERHQELARHRRSGAVTTIPVAAVERPRREASNSTTDRRGGPLVKAHKPPGDGKKRTGNHNKKLAECLAVHNKYRRMHHVPELQFDAKIAAFARKRSEFIAASDGEEFRHPPDLPYGENLFWHSNPKTGCEHMVKGWYDEIKLFDFKQPSFASDTGHFTQVVWRETRRVGCAFAESSGPRGGLFLTCNYDPPGNVYGSFKENVPRPMDTQGAKDDTNVLVTTAANTTDLSEPATTQATTTTSMTPTTPSDVTSTTTKLKSKKKKKKKKKDKKKPDSSDKVDKKKKRKKKKKKKKSTTTTSAPDSTTT